MGAVLSALVRRRVIAPAVAFAIVYALLRVWTQRRKARVVRDVAVAPCACCEMPRPPRCCTQLTTIPVGASRSQKHRWKYDEVRSLLSHSRVSMPCVLVHMDAFEANARRYADIARRHGKTIRVGSKSVRVPALIFRLMELYPDVYQGVLCFRYAPLAGSPPRSYDHRPIVCHRTSPACLKRGSWRPRHHGSWRSPTVMWRRTWTSCAPTRPCPPETSARRST